MQLRLAELGGYIVTVLGQRIFIYILNYLQMLPTCKILGAK